MTRVSIATIMGVEPECHGGVAAIVSALTGIGIELCLSAKNNGEVSIQLDAEQAPRLLAALAAAIEHAKRPTANDPQI